MSKVQVTTIEECKETILKFYIKVAEEELLLSVSSMVEEQVREQVRTAVRDMLEKPLKARVTKELKLALAEDMVRRTND